MSSNSLGDSALLDDGGGGGGSLNPRILSMPKLTDKLLSPQGSPPLVAALVLVLGLGVCMPTGPVRMTAGELMELIPVVLLELSRRCVEGTSTDSDVAALKLSSSV
jgi:hypothetical protein